jgi:hypothetical protein
MPPVLSKVLVVSRLSVSLLVNVPLFVSAPELVNVPLFVSALLLFSEISIGVRTTLNYLFPPSELTTWWHKQGETLMETLI